MAVIKIKTIVELFDACQLENVVAGLRFKPEKIVFVGFDEMDSNRQEAIEKFFGMKRIRVIVEYEKIEDRYDYNAIYSKLLNIVETNSDCCFDLTGGREFVLAAMGEISAVKNIPMVQFDVKTGDFKRVKNCDGIEPLPKCSIKVDENVVLNGGTVIHGDKNDYNWNLNGELWHTIDILWNICKADCAKWNFQCGVFDNFEKYGYLDLKTLTVKAEINILKEHKKSTHIYDDILDLLKLNGYITDYKNDGKTITYRYKNSDIHQCLTKAGNVLELYTYKTAHEINQKNPGLYDDIDIGVFVDWDGKVFHKSYHKCETRNEVDVVIMRDMIPVFISCKNGNLDNEALYELYTVADKFGGQYAKKILLTSYVNSDKSKRRYLLKRAEDMGIITIEDVDKMTKKEFAGELIKHTIS